MKQQKEPIRFSDVVTWAVMIFLFIELINGFAVWVKTSRAKNRIEYQKLNETCAKFCVEKGFEPDEYFNTPLTKSRCYCWDVERFKLSDGTNIIMGREYVSFTMEIE